MKGLVVFLSGCVILTLQTDICQEDGLSPCVNSACSTGYRCTSFPSDNYCCPVGTSSCVDADPTNCPVAAAEGACSQTFYQQNCQKSCGVCSASGSCVDSDPTNCPKAAAMGSCSQTFYQTNCKLSCNMC